MELRILFVCTGNTCRSPMAEALMNEIAKERGWHTESLSAGVFVSEEIPVSRLAKRALEEIGIRNFSHKSVPVTGKLLQEVDLVVAMTEDHKTFLMQKFSPKTTVIPMPRSIPDPYGKDAEAYLETALLIRQGLEDLIDAGWIYD